MDADMYDGTSEQEDLQATQLVHDLLAPGSSPMRSMELRNPLLRNLFAESNEISADSQLSSRGSNSAPQYHFHGLASTQTQSQSQAYAEDMEVDMEEGSQKENIGAGRTTAKEGPQAMTSPGPRSPSPRPSPSKDLRAVPGAMSNNKLQTVTKKANNTVTFESPRHNTRASVSPLKAVTRQSPHKPGGMSTRHKPLPKPPSRASSVDSFARDPELENAEDRLIANAEQFNIPISELGRGSSRQDTSDASGGTMANLNRMTGRAGRGRPTTGRVLCPDSQESPDESRSHEEPRSLPTDLEETQPFDLQETQLIPEHEQEPSGNSYESSQAQSDIAEFYGKKTHDDIPKRPATTTGPKAAGAGASATSMEQTQPASQTGEEEEFAREKASLFDLPAATFASTSTRSFGRPGLKSHYTDEQESEEQDFGQTTSSDLVETQPSFPEAPPPKRGFPAPKVPFKKPQQLKTRPIDPADVVPDSEPSAPAPTPAPAAPTPKPKPQPQPQPQEVPGPSKQSPAPAYTTPLGKKKAGAKGASSAKPVADALPVVQEEPTPESSSDEGSPLASTVVKRPKGRTPASTKGKGKEKAAAADPPPLPPTAVKEKEKAPAKPPTTRRAARNDRSWETSIIPSSVPDQDAIVQCSVVEPPPPAVKPEKTTPAVPKGKGKRPAEEDDDRSEQQEEEEQPEEPEDLGRNKRRKRVPLPPPPPSERPQRGASKRPRRGVTATPLKSEPSSSVEGTRVFALWPQDGHWYAGAVHEEVEEGRYHVYFDDTNKHILRVPEMRLCALRPDDEVLYGALNRPARVVSVDERRKRVTVEFDGKTEEKEMRDLRIPNTTIRYGWSDRTLSRADIVTTHSRQATATPSGPTAVDSSANNGPKPKHLMGSTGFIITAGDTGEKNELQNQVQRLGGHILDSFPTDVIDLKGQFSDKKNSWILSKKQAVWKGDRNTKRLFLIAEDPLLTPKYLMALALGIPCVSQAWLTDSAESDLEKDWSTYLLPQGFSPTIGARLSQQVDADWGSSIYHLHRIMDNGVPSKLFRDMNILYVLSDSASQKGPKKITTLIADDKAQPSYILLGMGAETVETVATSTYATKSLDSYDYIVVRDNCSQFPDYVDCPNVVEWTWVKECLIASRILPIPSRTPDDE